MPDRLARAARFVLALQTVSRKNPNSWRSVASIGEAADIQDPEELAQAVRDAVAASLVYRRVDDDFVLLTDKGRGIAAD